MRRGGHILADLMDRLRDTVKGGMSTLEIDEDVESFITARGAKAAFKGYRGFPATVCISINEEVVHGIPSAHGRVKEGDNVGLDLGCIVDGYYAGCTKIRRCRTSAIPGVDRSCGRGWCWRSSRW